MTPDWPMGVLRSCLLDLLRELEGKDFPLIMCGGFGLYLKQMSLLEPAPGYLALLPGELWPRPRATEDMDILIATEILADAERFARMREALDRLGYRPIPGAEYMQFRRRLEDGSNVKVDLLTGPVPDELRDKVTIRSRRIRPAGRSLGLHAHRTDEAIAFQQNLRAIPIDGECTDGRPYRGTVFIPPAVTFLMMKLFAFRDRNQDQQKDFARHHAMDLYRLVAMFSYEEFRQTRAEIRDRWADPIVLEGARIVAGSFTGPACLGAIRVREHPLFEPDMDIPEFLRALGDLLSEP